MGRWTSADVAIGQAQPGGAPRRRKLRLVTRRTQRSRRSSSPISSARTGACRAREALNLIVERSKAEIQTREAVLALASERIMLDAEFANRKADLAARVAARLDAQKNAIGRSSALAAQLELDDFEPATPVHGKLFAAGVAHESRSRERKHAGREGERAAHVDYVAELRGALASASAVVLGIPASLEYDRGKSKPLA